MEVLVGLLALGLLLVPILSFGQNSTIKKEINIKSESSSFFKFSCTVRSS